MSSHKSEFGSESDGPCIEAPKGDGDVKRRDLVRQLKSIFDKVPPESLYDVLANGVLNGLKDIPLDALENIVSISEEEAEVYLENPPPPSLNAFELKAEVSVLLEELYRLSAEAAHAKEPKWEEWTFVLEQVADSLTKWLRNIWLCVWEYRTSFEKAHECLMVAQGFLETLTATKLGCVCPFATLPLIVKFHDLSGDVVRTWQNLTGNVLQEVIFWVWRELFMSILITKRPQHERLIKNMIHHIEGSYGASHHIILFGGSPDGFGVDGYYNDAALELEDEELEDYDDLFEETINDFWPEHWTEVDDEFEELKAILLEAARGFFSAHPTLHGYLTLCSLEPIRGDLHAVLLENAPFSRAVALCALAVFRHSHSLELLQTILETCAHLFEAHDTPSLRLSVECLLRHPETMDFGQSFVQQQLQDSLEAIKIALYNTFRLDRVTLAMDSLLEISSLTPRSTNRTEKVKAWVKDLLIPVSAATDPFSLAAMVFGFPPPETEEIIEDEEAALAAHFLETSHAAEFDGLLETLNVTSSRPHIHDLCELNRRHLVKRLLALLSLVDDMPQNARPARYKTLLAFERAVFKELPWMRFPDVVAELKVKYSRRLHEGHLKSALECLQTFLEKQKAHHIRVRNARKKAAEAAKPQATPSPAATTSLIDDVD